MTIQENERWKYVNRRSINDYFEVYEKAGGTPYPRIKKMSPSSKKWVDKLPDVETRKAQGCEVCGSKRRASVDHDHLTGEIRGILCGLCNSALGFARDNPKILAGLIAYLTKV